MLASVGAAALLLPGCAVGPNYKRPAINSPTHFRNASTEASTNTVADLQWWELYKDETLNSLIQTALTNNYDLRIAITRVEQARAIAGQAKAQLVPRIGYEGATSRGRNEFLGNANPPGHLRSANAQVGVSVAEFLPKVGLTTFFGKVSGELSAFTAGSANA